VTRTASSRTDVSRNWCAKNEADVVILDYDDAESGGRAAVLSMRETSAVPILALSVRSDEKTAVGALNSGADDCIRKPWGTQELLAWA
jgi:two-component system, OmpR family, KDP operon response regulator KdpE